MNAPIVIIPTYNEAGNLAAILAGLRRAGAELHVLVVDDGSPDGTGDVADHFSLVDHRVHVLHRAGKQGLGAAYRAGFAWAADHGYEQIVQMDADGSHDPADVPRLLSALADADVVVGSRWVPGGEAVGWPAHRLLLSRGGSAYARRMLALGQRDVTSGFRAFRRSALGRIDPATVGSTGYCFQIEVLRRASGAGLAVAEIPIVFTDRRLGASKMSTAIVAEAMLRVTVWGLQRLAHGRRTAVADEAMTHA
jgi:dolichol-phosphate mannosyltransferase